VGPDKEKTQCTSKRVVRPQPACRRTLPCKRPIMKRPSDLTTAKGNQRLVSCNFTINCRLHTPNVGMFTPTNNQTHAMNWPGMCLSQGAKNDSSGWKALTQRPRLQLGGSTKPNQQTLAVTVI
jgi:hypothetical protein